MIIRIILLLLLCNKYRKFVHNKWLFFIFRITKYLGYDPDSLVSKSVFDYYHAQDCNFVEKSFKICKFI